MANEILKRDDNHVPVSGAITDDVNQEVRQLRVDPTTKRLKVAAVIAGAPGNLAVLNEGVLLTNTPTSLDFVGVGVTASAVGDDVTVTISGGGGGGGPFSDITGQPYEVAYFDAAGNGTSDQYFVRDDINFNTTLITPIDADRSVKLITDFDGSTLSVPAIANLYEDSNLGITTGFFISGELGSESSQMIFQDGTNTVSVALDSINAVLSYANADFTTSFSATDIGAAMVYNDTLNSVQAGLSFGSQYARLSRTTDDTVQIGAVEIGPTYLEIYRRVTGLRRHGSILMEDDLITIGDPAGQSTDTNIIVDIANEVITLSTGQTTIDSGQIIKGRTVVDAIITIGLDDYLVTGASISVDRVASLPAIGVGAGEAVQNVTFIIKNKSNSSANITLTPDGTDTIDGAATLTIIPGQSYTIVSDGSGDWEVI